MPTNGKNKSGFEVKAGLRLTKFVKINSNLVLLHFVRTYKASVLPRSFCKEKRNHLRPSFQYQEKFQKMGKSLGFRYLTDCAVRVDMFKIQLYPIAAMIDQKKKNVSATENSTQYIGIIEDLKSNNFQCFSLQKISLGYLLT